MEESLSVKNECTGSTGKTVAQPCKEKPAGNYCPFLSY
jgi:hypothetical protein